MSDADPPPDELDAAASSIAALGDPTRRRLYRLVARAGEPVSREQAAEALGVAAHTVKFHLDRLVDEGLLEVEFRRLTGRSGPGAGRPAKLYRRSERELTVSLPARHYDLLSEILARSVEVAVAQGAPVDRTASAVARDAGRSIGAAAAARDGNPGDSLVRLAASLRPHGYEPRVEAERMVLENCPFDKVARNHTALVCGLNLDLVSGAAAGLGCTDLSVSLRPLDGRCCVSASRD
jgi:predicted ArsR family transcriptional regulator